MSSQLYGGLVSERVDHDYKRSKMRNGSPEGVGFSVNRNLCVNDLCNIFAHVEDGEHSQGTGMTIASSERWGNSV